MEDFDAYGHCNDCGVPTTRVGSQSEYYMLKNEVWKSIVPPAEDAIFLCIGCVENRLGRILNEKDFNTAVPLNYYANEKNSSERLRNRLGSINIENLSPEKQKYVKELIKQTWMS